jgi:mitochondrial fission protein ELM1
MASLESAIKREIYFSKTFAIPRIFGEALIANNQNPTVAAFREAVGEFSRLAWFDTILQEAKTALEPHLPRMRKGDTPLFITYYGHPDSVLTGLAMKALYPNTILVGLGYPYRSVNSFDLIAAPPFPRDAPEGLPHFELDALPSHVTVDFLTNGRREWEPDFAALNHRYLTNDDFLIGLLVGGPFPIFAPDPREARVVGEAAFTDRHARDFCRQAMALRNRVIRETGKERVDFLITTSSRTPASVRDIIFGQLAHHSRWIHDPRNDRGPNPLPGILALSNILVPTCDSLCLTSDAVAASKLTEASVVVFAPESHMRHPLDVQGVHRHFCETLHGNGMVTYMGEPLKKPDFPFDFPAEAIAKQIKHLLWQRKNKRTPRVTAGTHAVCG